MSFELPVFYKRAVSGLIYVVFMLTGLLSRDIWGFVALIGIIQLLCLKEYFFLAERFDDTYFYPHWLPIVVQITGALWLLAASVMVNFQFLWPALLCVPAAILLYTFLAKENTWLAGMHAIVGMVYIMLPMVLLVQLRIICILIPVATVLMIWTNDTAAYIVGSFVGKTPVSVVSPNKSWEGIIGGGVLTALVGWAIGMLTKSHFHVYNNTDWIVISLIVSVTGPFGDLLQSKLKRMANVKDSGNILPGHGGALDRLDSLIFTVPFVFCYAYFFMPHVDIVLF
jgi:phosphatidate cytidylyltransferase